MEEQRESFEDWASNDPFGMDIGRYPDEPDVYAWPGQYYVTKTQLAWEAWKEATARKDFEISHLNKSYGCEVMDPAGTIWDYAEGLKNRVKDFYNLIQRFRDISRDDNSDTIYFYLLENMRDNFPEVQEK